MFGRCRARSRRTADGPGSQNDHHGKAERVRTSSWKSVPIHWLIIPKPGSKTMTLIAAGRRARMGEQARYRARQPRTEWYGRHGGSDATACQYRQFHAGWADRPARKPRNRRAATSPSFTFSTASISVNASRRSPALLWDIRPPATQMARKNHLRAEYIARFWRWQGTGEMKE